MHNKIFEEHLVQTNPVCLKIFKDINNYSKEILELSFGSLGEKILNFCNSIDKEHPGVLETSISENSELMSQMLQVSDFVSKQNLHLFFDDFSKCVFKKYAKSFKNIDDPRKNYQHIRFLEDKKEREIARKSKKVFSVSSSAFYGKAKKFWDSYPKTFNVFYRNECSYKYEVDKYKHKINSYKDLGLNHLSYSLEKSISYLESKFDSKYYGFNKITITDASIVLAKMHGFYPYRNSRAENYIVIKNNDGCYLYVPKVYPLHELKIKTPSLVQKIINHLESFPECKNKSIFDHYLVLTPTVGKHLNIKTEFENNFSNSFSTNDFCLIENDLVTPIVLGEKDGSCYFICTWN